MRHRLIDAGPGRLSSRSGGDRSPVPAVALALLAFGLVTGLSGCAGDTTGPKGRDAIVLHGFLYVGETMTPDKGIRLGRVGAIDESFNADEMAIDDALVVLRSEQPARLDTLPRVGPGVYANQRAFVLPGRTYHLRVELANGDTLTASTTTPDWLELRGGPPPFSVSPGALADHYPVYVDGPDTSQVMLCDLYCASSWTDARYINPFGDHDRPDDAQEYGGENGEPRHLFAYFRLGDLARGPSGGYLLDFYSALIVFYGQYELNVMAIDDNAYRWLYQDHPEESGGVQGGIGVFGSAFRKRWYIDVTE